MLDLTSYWRDHPPVHELLAAFLGVKPTPTALPVTAPPPSADDPSGIGGLLARFPSGFVPANR